jgi:hypothetical protein
MATSGRQGHAIISEIEDPQENATDLTDRPRSLKITSTP